MPSLRLYLCYDKKTIDLRLKTLISGTSSITIYDDTLQCAKTVLYASLHENAHGFYVECVPDAIDFEVPCERLFIEAKVGAHSFFTRDHPTKAIIDDTGSICICLKAHYYVGKRGHAAKSTTAWSIFENAPAAAPELPKVAGKSPRRAPTDARRNKTKKPTRRKIDAIMHKILRGKIALSI